MNPQENVEVIKQTVTEVVSKFMLPKLDHYTDALMEKRLREIIREELLSLMKESESLFVARIADALIEKVTEKLATK